ncbi:RusA-like Holliday junction resolvase [Roseobacter phage RD-1410W1-01]|uniref:Endoribonuclease RusA n=1 Tax=Roseobacter phage RD-1410W1-01 TaxID=1815984 RepID=A0A191VYL2_9CAUD|nr:RusA-like Holliday junction resolvase [Roseobacter phage RD-1410W1-01]ANJ20796.1 endoribonuclease RusA [Roseobacter phage RD-1410W1-01]
MDKIWIHYTVFAPTARTLDTMNVGSIVDKYFSDALTELGRIPDDNHKHIVFSSFSFGGIVKLDGHAIATIYELEEEKPMRILLDQADIQTALDNHVQTLGLTGASGVALSVNDAGEIEAEVQMGEAAETTAPAPKPKNKGGRPKGSRNKPKAPEVEETADVEESADDAGDGSDSGGSDASEEAAETGTDTATEGSETENPSEKPEPKSSSSIFESEGDEEGTSDSASGEAVDAAKPAGKKKSSIFDVD